MGISCTLTVNCMSEHKICKILWFCIQIIEKIAKQWCGGEKSCIHCNHCKFRSSRPEVFRQTGILKNLSKFTEKHLCQSLFFYKVAGLMPATLLKRDSGTGFFLVNFETFLRTPFYYRTPPAATSVNSLYSFESESLDLFRSVLMIDVHT